MKFSKKSLLMAVSIVLCMTMTALGTVAYLTDRAAIANTFTVGNIDITVDEKLVDENGKEITDAKLVDHDVDVTTPDKPMTEDEYTAWTEEHPNMTHKPFAELPDANGRTQYGNEYKLVPGVSYEKDPTMTVKAGSEAAYVRMVVTINKADELKAIFGDDFLPQNYVEEWDAESWPCVEIDDTVAGQLTYFFNYKEAVGPTDKDVELPPLFKKIVIPDNLTKEQLATLQGLKIDVEGHAIQTAAFTDDDPVKQAWEAFEAQNTAAGTP